jgi:uncharacterized membrane protein
MVPRGIDVETLVASVLIGGLLASVTLIAIGVVWLRARTGTFQLDYLLPATNVGAFILGDIRQAASPAVGPRRLINLGIGVLMLTPYLRVLTSLLYFLVAHNRKYSLFTAIVLLALTYSMLQ